MADLTKFNQMTISLKSANLGDSYAVDRLLETALGSSFSGSLWGWPWGFTVSRRAYGAKRYALTGDYDVKDLLKKYIAFGSAMTGASSIMGNIAAGLSKTAVINIDDFSIRPISVQSTVMGAIGSLFSWTSQIPHQLVNVFLRGGNLHVLQRGKEASSYTLQKYGPPTITEEIVDTLMDDSLIEPVIIGEDSDEETSYYSGVKGFGDVSVSYSNGLVVSESYTGQEGTVSTSYLWSAPYPPSVLSRKTVTYSGGKTITTDYDYSAPWGVVYLCQETEVKKDSQGVTTNTLVKRFSDVGNDSYKCDIEENGKLKSSQIVKGTPVQAASPLASKKYTTSQRKITVMSRQPIGGASFPVTDQTTLNRIAAQLEWLDGKTQQTVQVACYDQHVCDFTETVNFMGQTFYLDANAIHVTPQKIWQELTLVRWF